VINKLASLVVQVLLALLHFFGQVYILHQVPAFEALLAYSVILNKDPDNYKSYTPQHKIGKSLNKEPGSLIKYYKAGHQEDGYNGYSTNYQDLDIDIYKIELWKLIKDILGLLDCDIQKLEDQTFPTIIEEDDNYDTTLFDTIQNSKASKKNDANDRQANKNIQRNESLDKYRSLSQYISCGRNETY
jgi:hypothetical protein